MCKFKIKSGNYILPFLVAGYLFGTSISAQELDIEALRAELSQSFHTSSSSNGSDGSAEALAAKEQELLRRLDGAPKAGLSNSMVESAAGNGANSIVPQIGNHEVASLKKEKSSLSRKVSQLESKLKDKSRELEEARNRLVVAETQLSRLSSILDRRNKDKLSELYGEAPARKQPAVLLEKKAPEAEENANEMQIATIMTKKGNLRTGPGLEHSPIMTVAEGTRLAVETRQGEWYRVISPNGSRAWVSGQIIAFKNNADSNLKNVKVKAYDPRLSLVQ